MAGYNALFGRGGFSNTDDQVAHAIERFLFTLVFYGPIGFVTGLIIGQWVGHIRAKARREELLSAQVPEATVPAKQGSEEAHGLTEL